MSHQVASEDRIVDAMIDLARLSRSQRVIVTGAYAFETYLGLLDRGFSRVATTATCRSPCGQHDVALVMGRHSVPAIEALLTRIVPFLNPHAVVALWMGSDGHQHGKALQQVLERLGFRIEAGARCEDGFVVSARRRESSPVVNAAQGPTPGRRVA
jgi:hypothetical protein